MRSLPRLLACAVLLATPPLAAGARAQSLLERTPNVTGGWTGGPNSLHFNFLHRFNQSGPPLRQVTNRPTFLLAYGAPGHVLAGVQYATRSDVVARIPNEWEVFGRYGVLGEGRGHPLDVAAQLAYNAAAESVDGEVSLARRLGPLRVLAAGRAFSAGYGGDARYAIAGGAALKLGNWIALTGDAGTLLDTVEGEEVAWGAAIQFGIPLTPHSFSLQATNTNSSTLQGASRGADEVRYGFEFTVPVALARYFGRRAPPAAEPVAAPAANADSLRRVALADSIRRELETEYRRRWQADSLRFALRDDSVRLAQQLDSIRRVASEDSIRRAGEAEARRVADENARRDAEREQAARTPFRASIRNLTFEPARITIDAGTTIIWRNNDQVEHTVTSRNGSFDSGTIRPGASWQRTFNTPGTYEFICTPHPFMTGVVIVRERR